MKPLSPVKVPRLSPGIRRVVPPMVSDLRKRNGSTRRRRPAETRDMCEDCWVLSEDNKSPEAHLISPTRVLFHPSWSNGHAACRADRPLDPDCIHYWEVAFCDRVFGTAMQVGLVTSSASLHADRFLCNLLGMDEHSWGFSHKGLAWHEGNCATVCPAFPECKPTVIGLLFNGPAGTLSLFKDDEPLGVVFQGFNEVREDLYPAFSSTAAKTSMTVIRKQRSFSSLQDRCRAVLARFAPTPTLAALLPLPPSLRNWLVATLPRQQQQQTAVNVALTAA